MMKNLCILSAAGFVFCLFAGQVTLAQEAKEEPKPAEVKPTDVSQADRRKEGEKLLQAMCDKARVVYAMNDEAPKTLTADTESGGCSATAEELKGDYCKLHDKVYAVTDKPGSAALIAEDVVGKDGFAILIFQWESGDSKVEWYDTLDALKKAHEDVKLEDKATESGNDTEGKEAGSDEGEIDVWATYRKEGRNWTYEITGGIKMKTTIKNVTEDGCDMETQMYMNGQPMGAANTTPLKFSTPKNSGEDAPEAPKPLEKEIECKAGKFVCVSYDDGNTWMMKKYLGIIVKSQAMELIEFNEGDED
ncbi:MAG: hypothetical protein KDB90_10685 [Planctomycetes bacterium]|nr:hypothetical protein [Planctomycetota bacterium]